MYLECLSLIKGLVSAADFGDLTMVKTGGLVVSVSEASDLNMKVGVIICSGGGETIKSNLSVMINTNDRNVSVVCPLLKNIEVLNEMARKFVCDMGKVDVGNNEAIHKQKRENIVANSVVSSDGECFVDTFIDIDPLTKYTWSEIVEDVEHILVKVIMSGVGFEVTDSRIEHQHAIFDDNNSGLRNHCGQGITVVNYNGASRISVRFSSHVDEHLSSIMGIMADDILAYVKLSDVAQDVVAYKQ